MCRHPARVYTNLKDLLAECSNGKPDGVRFWTKTWRSHVEKRGNVPYVMKCAVCSGEERRADIKYGKRKLSRPVKSERDEDKSSC